MQGRVNERNVLGKFLELRRDHDLLSVMKVMKLKHNFSQLNINLFIYQITALTYL